MLVWLVISKRITFRMFSIATMTWRIVPQSFVFMNTATLSSISAVASSYATMGTNKLVISGGLIMTGQYATEYSNTVMVGEMVGDTWVWSATVPPGFMQTFNVPMFTIGYVKHYVYMIY